MLSGDEADGGEAAGIAPMIATPATGRLVAMDVVDVPHRAVAPWRAADPVRLALPDPTRTSTRDGDRQPLPATPTDPEPRNLASSTSTGHDRLDLVSGDLLRFAA